MQANVSYNLLVNVIENFVKFRIYFKDTVRIFLGKSAIVQKKFSFFFYKFWKIRRLS